jgi:hypothetical protein
MIAWLKSSMEFCKQAFAQLSDAKLGESITWVPGGPGAVERKVTRFTAVSWVNNVLIER